MSADAERRHDVALRDACALKKKRPDFVVSVPVVLFNAEVSSFLESLAAIAKRGDEFTAPRVAVGAVLYATIDGRLHRVTVEDLEPELR